MDINQYIKEIEERMKRQQAEIEGRMRNVMSGFDQKSSIPSIQHSEMQNQSHSVSHGPITPDDLQCPSCGEWIEPGLNECPVCGSPLETEENNRKNATKNSHEGKESTLRGLKPFKGMEDISLNRLHTFNKVYEGTFAEETGLHLALSKKPELDFASLIIDLSVIAEIECYSSIIPYHCGGKVNKKYQDLTFGELISIISDKVNLPQELFPNRKHFIEELRWLKDKRNDAAHPKTIFGKKEFLSFYYHFSDFYNHYIPIIVELKDRRSKHYGSFGVEKLGEDDDYEFPDVLDKNSESSDHLPARKTCLILTDCKKLSVKYKSVEDWANCYYNKLSRFTDINTNLGYHYIIIDVGNSQYSCLFEGDTSWQQYLKLLDKVSEEFGIDENHPVSLMILGGDDVIPVPLLNNGYALYEDKGRNILENDVHTDFPYSFHSSAININADGTLDWQRLSNRAPRFYVSRLPLESGLMSSSMERDIFDIYEDKCSGYLARVLVQRAEGDIKISNPCYVGCETAKITTANMVKDFPSMNINEIPNCVENGVFVSPVIDLKDETIDENKIYEKALSEADMLIFNLHSNPMPTGGYSGQKLIDKPHDNNPRKAYCVFEPLAPQTSAKIISAVCCWGAKFIGYARENSTLLSRLYHSSTLLFLGSSRSAYGHFSPMCKGCDNPYLGQVIIVNYTKYLLEGVPAAEALTRAKIDYIQQTFNMGNPCLSLSLLSVLQFNLYGDPLLMVAPTLKPQSYSSSLNLPAWEKSAIFDTPNISLSSSSGHSSLISRLRSRVNENIADIRSRIAKRLYAEYGLEPRNLQYIKPEKSVDGSQAYTLIYQDPENFSDGHIAITDNQGNVFDLFSKL